MTSLPEVENFDIEVWFRATYVETPTGKVSGYVLGYEEMLQMFLEDHKNMVVTECGTGIWVPAMQCVIPWKDVYKYQRGQIQHEQGSLRHEQGSLRHEVKVVPRDLMKEMYNLQAKLAKLEMEREERERAEYKKRNSMEHNLNILKVQLPKNDLLSREDKETKHSFAVSESEDPVWDGITLEAMYNLFQSIDRRLKSLENPVSYYSYD
tara:strand:- start:132 stop:755 length:624 start_codon:yes stop_codon:yes gene_type:complete